jgi:hypothetical protein
MKMNFESGAEDHNIIVTKKIKELTSRFQAGDRKGFDDLSRALDWYMTARNSKKSESELDERGQEVLQNQVSAIENNNQSYETMDAEFSSFNDDEIKLIKQGLFRF